MMKKLWSYLAVGFAFFSVGIIVAVKWLNKAGTEIIIKKVKSKRNTGQSDINIPVNIDNTKMVRSDRRIDRLAKRIEDKRRKSLRRLEK